MKPFNTVTSRVAALPLDNINTDQIIPARFLKRTESEGWGPFLFADRKSDPHFVLNDSRLIGAMVLLGGVNFGCGSSREHAAWALRDAGFRVVVAPSFADIFRENALKNGILPARLAPRDYAEFGAQIAAASESEWTIDLLKQTMTSGQCVVPFEIDSFARTCLMEGLDGLGYILGHEYLISDYEALW